MFQRVFPIFAVKIIRFYIKFGSLVQFEAHTFIVANYVEGDSELLPEMSFQLLECHSLITDALSCQSTWVTVVAQCITSPRCCAWLLRRTISVYSICYNSLPNPTLAKRSKWHTPGGVLRFGSDGGVPLEPPNQYLSLRVILAEKGTYY